MATDTAPATTEAAHPHSDPPKPSKAALIAKWVAIGLALLVLLVMVQALVVKGLWLPVIGLAFLAMAILVIYGPRKNVPLKYLFPGLVFLVLLQIWPIAYTVATAFTNYGDGHTLSKQESIDAAIAQSVREVPGAARYKLSVAVKEGQDVKLGDLNFLLTDPEGKTFVGDATGLKELTEGVEKNEAGKITRAAGYTVLTPVQVNQRQDVQQFAVPTSEGNGIKPVGLSEAFEGRATVTYDPASDSLTDTATGKKYIAKDATWAPEDGQGDTFATGWKENVGFKNFVDVLTDSNLRAGFVKIFIWNFVFAVVSVLSTFLLGMLLALLLNDEKLKGKSFYRSVLILPYALPGFVTALVWASMFNQEFGLINDVTGLNVDWLGNAWAAKAAILITNLWLGFPYMFVVCTGALQSIPSDVKEAAKIDGAGPMRTLRSITMPLLLVAVGPLLIASFAFNFNNFGLIYLLTKGGPFDSGDTSIGSSDLLITYAYRLAFSGVNPNFGLAATISIFIFIIVALMSLQGFRRTKSLEEVN